MGYQVTCGCGKSVSVRSSDAGTTRRCECGRDVEVPSLHHLRLSAGEEALSPALRLQTKLGAGLLPGVCGCALCGCEPAPSVLVYLECEREQVGGRGEKADLLAGCLLFGALWLVLAANRREPRVRHGTDVFFYVPLPLCEACRADVSDPAVLVRALRTIPDYADLLDRHPETRVLLRPGAHSGAGAGGDSVHGLGS